MNRRQASAALLHYRRQKHHRFWVHPINQSHQQFGEFNTLYKGLRKYPGRFYTSYRMSTEQFNHILAQIEQFKFTNETLTSSIVYLQKKNLQYVSGSYIYYHLLSFKSIKHVHPTAHIITHLETVLYRDGYVLSSHRCLCVILCINIDKFYYFW